MSEPGDATAAHRPLAELVGSLLPSERPALIGLGGGVAVGKSTTAGILQALLAGGPGRPVVEVVATDGFLLPNAVLEERSLADKKGYPESYDRATLDRFLDAVRAGSEGVRVPVYSHDTYDVLEGDGQVLGRADVVIVEGLNVLGDTAPPDRFDLTIYIDADEADIERWFVERIVGLRVAALDDETSFYRQLAAFSEDDVRAFAHAVWASINGPNLREHVLPARAHADVVVEKAPDHSIRRIHQQR